MLLRTSSAPVLSSLSNPYFLQADTCKDSLEPPHHVHNSNLSSFHSLVPPSALPGRGSWDGHGICAGDDASEGELDRISRPSRLSRAQSEGDLACFSTAMSVVASEKHGFSGYDAGPANIFTERTKRIPRVPSNNAISSFDLTESILEEIDEADSTCSSHLHPFPLSRSDTFLDPKFPQGLVLNDGERYSTFKLSSSGSPLACNDKGCRPLTHSECKELGFLDMASGVGVSAYVWNEGDEGGALDVSNNREAYYQSLLQNDPENPLLLRNYAQFLSKKGDVKKAEEYYERAILVDPNDGEVLSQYAKLQWDVNRDQDRAETYYDQAVKAAPADCYVMASYASFLWDVEDNEDGSPATQALPAYSVSPVVCSPLLASA